MAQIKDDLVVRGKGRQHDVRLDQVLKRCEEYNVTLRAPKCHFAHPKVCWFGNVYSKEGMSLDPEKVQLIKKWPEPEDKSVVKSLL